MGLRLLMLACSLAAMAQDAKTLLENDSVKVVRTVLRPRYAADRVVVSLGSGETKWVPGGMEISSKGAQDSIEVELKKSASASRQTASALSPLVVDPKHYSLELENDHVRVTRVKIGPRERAPLHEHAMGRVVVYLTEQEFRITPERGTPELVVHKPGDVGWGGAAKHAEENLAAKHFEAVVIEVKN